MSTQTLTRRRSSAAAGSTKLIALARLIRRRARIWEDRRQLDALPDYLLADMGISRSEIDRSMERGRGCPLGPNHRF